MIQVFLKTWQLTLQLDSDHTCVLADVTDQMECQRGEIFGPILPLRPFTGVAQAIEFANKVSVLFPYFSISL